MVIKKSIFKNTERVTDFGEVFSFGNIHQGVPCRTLETPI